MTKTHKEPLTHSQTVYAKCPYCGVEILRTQKKCHECEAHYTDDEIEELTKDLDTSPKSCFILIAAILLAGLLVYAVGSKLFENSGQRNYEVEKLMLEQMAKQRVRAVLRDPSSAEFSGILARPTGEEGKGIVCGYVRFRNGFGEMSGPQRFIVTDTSFHIEEQASSEEIRRNWDILCNL